MKQNKNEMFAILKKILNFNFNFRFGGKIYNFEVSFRSFFKNELLENI